MRFLLPLAAAASSLVLFGCGVAFGPAEERADFFESLEVTGDEMRAGAPLTVTVEYNQKYPVDVEVVCEIRRNKQLVQVIGERNVASLPGGGPEATPVVGTASFEFRLDDPGSYRAECYTPADEDNYIREQFRITGEAAAS